MSTRDPRLPSLISLNNIVSEVMSDIKEFTSHDRLNYLKWVIRGVDDLRATLPMHCINDFQVERLILNDVNSAELPADFIDWKVVGYDLDGVAYGLVSNPAIVKLDEPTCETPVNPNTEKKTPTIPSHFGAPAGISKNDFRIILSKASYVIQFNNKMPVSTIYVEYLSSGVSLNGETFVERQYKEALIAFVLWKRIDNDPSIPFGEKQRKERIFYDRKRELFYMRNTYTIAEIINAFRSGYAQTPKR